MELVKLLMAIDKIKRDHNGADAILLLIMHLEIRNEISNYLADNID